MSDDDITPRKPSDAPTQEEYKQQFLDAFDGRYSPITDIVHRDEIGGLEKIVDDLDRFKRGIEHPFLYEIMGGRPPKGFLLVGPPGVGKTHIAKYLANELNARFVDLPLQAFESKWVGEAEKLLAAHLENFMEYSRLMNRPVMVFFDEGEETFKSRGMEGWHGPRVNLLLRAMDGLGTSEGIIFGAATNYEDKIDDAIKRPGRLDYIIRIPEYDALMMGDVFRAQRDYRNRRSVGQYNPFRLTLDDCAELGKRAKQKNLSPADVAEIYRRAIEEKVRIIVEETTDIFDLDKNTYTMNKSDMENILSAYENGEKTKRPIGFFPVRG